MNYFEFYNISASFNPDMQEVKRKFYELSKKYHPDFFVNETPEKQQEILELSTLNNKAYQVLSSKTKRIEYILELNNLLAEGEKYQLPQSFLIEMMDINEELMELEFDPNEGTLSKVKEQVSAIEEELDESLNNLTKAYDGSPDADKNFILLEIKDIWYRKKYLLRIKDSLNTFASRI